MIILRREVDKLLAENGLPELTVSRDSSSKLVTLVGKDYGEEILTLSDMQVPPNMSKAARDILLEAYIKVAITKHKADLIELINCKKEAKKKKEVRDVEHSRLADIGIDKSIASYSLSSIQNRVNIEVATEERRSPKTISIDYKEGKVLGPIYGDISIEGLTSIVKASKGLGKKLKKLEQLEIDYIKALDVCKEVARRLTTTCDW